MMNKTIKQLADELGVSKTAIRKYMSEEFRQEHTETDRNGVITIMQSGCKLIAEIIGNNRKPIAEANENTVSDVLTIPREVWEALQGQLESQKTQIENLTEALNKAHQIADQSQHLQASSENRLLALEAPKKSRFGWFGKARSKNDEGQN